MHNSSDFHIVAAARQAMLVQGQKGLDVADRLLVKLLRIDPHHGYFDFTRM